jgi:predicted lipoprotein with Yx(FWY)xxD motif
VRQRFLSPAIAPALLLAFAAGATGLSRAGDAPAAAAAAPTTTATGDATTANDAVPAGIRLLQRGDEQLITDARGFALYTTDEDAQPGVSTCVDACAKAWPPFAAPADAAALGEFGLVKRADGTQQWSYRGKPLYGFAKDDHAGGTYGDGVGNRWRLAFRPLRTPPGIGVMKAPMGRILTNERGQALFTPLATDKIAVNACDAACLTQWSPAPAPALATDRGDWNVVIRADGTRQWAYRKQPMYSFRADRRAGDLKGFEPKHEGWTPIVVQPETPAPAWTTLVKTDVGQVFADPKGFTLYAFNGNLEKIRRVVCDDACLAKAWTQIEAEAGARPIGDWSIRKSPDGRQFWTYRGAPLYRFYQDAVPGEVRGNQFAAGAGIFGSWSPIVRIPY